MLSSGLSAIASGALPTAVVETAVPGGEEVSTTLRSFEPEFAANTSPNDGAATTPYGNEPTLTLPLSTGGLCDRSSTLMLSDPGLAT